MKKKIISVSRRTDIPAFYSDWFISRIKKGFTVYPNPVSGKPVFVDLSPEVIKAIVFWTRNPQPLFKHLNMIDKLYDKKHYMHFTINGFPEPIERGNNNINQSIEAVKFLSEKYGKHYVQWRFDPIIISSLTPVNFLYDNFEKISSSLRGYVKCCYISFVDLYKKTINNLEYLSETENIKFFEQNIETQTRIVGELNKIALKNDIEINCCAEDHLLNISGIKKASCISSGLISRIIGDDIGGYKVKPSRPGCGCIESQDIGYYGSCPNGCAYCYSNKSPKTAQNNAREYMKNGFPLDNLEFSKSADI